MRKKVCLVAGSPLTIRCYLIDQIVMLAGQFDLTVITNSDEPDFLADLGVSVTVRRVLIERDVSVWRDVLALGQLIRILTKEKFDVIHSVSPKSGLLAMAAAKIAKVPVRIHTFQGEVWVTRKGLWRSFLRLMDKLVARWATNLLVVSASEKRFLEEQKVVCLGKLEVLANGSICGVDLDRFRPDPGARDQVRESLGISKASTVILFVGRQNVDKGLLDLADAFERIARQRLDVHMLVVGPDEGRMRPRLESRCGQGRARLHFVDYTDVPERYMAASDLLCLPSYREGFGLVLIEAAAVGLATVGSRIYGILDAIVDNETGLMFTAGDVEELTDKLSQLISNPELRRKLGESGRIRAQRDFSKGLVISELQQYYKNLLLN